MELRAISRTGGVVGRAFLPPTDLAAIETFIAAHLQTHLYCGVATRFDASSGTLANCCMLSALFVDIDFKTVPEPEARRRLATFPLLPSLIVRSGGGLHTYWLLAEPVEVSTHEAEIRAALLGLAVKLGGDQGAAEPVRVLRMPGTVNAKPEYTPARDVVLDVAAAPGRRYLLDDILAFVPAVEPPTGASTPFVLRQIIRAGDRYATLFRLARSLKHRGLSPAAVRATLSVENAARCQPPHLDTELDRIVGNAFRSPDRPGFEPHDWAASVDGGPPPRDDDQGGGTKTEASSSRPTCASWWNQAGAAIPSPTRWGMRGRSHRGAMRSRPPREAAAARGQPRHEGEDARGAQRHSPWDAAVSAPEYIAALESDGDFLDPGRRFLARGVISEWFSPARARQDKRDARAGRQPRAHGVPGAPHRPRQPTARDQAPAPRDGGRAYADIEDHRPHEGAAAHR